MRSAQLGEPTSPRLLRCAVYTRKSSEHGLEQDFNSLAAQREAGEAYVRSQAHECWRLLATRYDDGAVSGGTLERPALSRLLADIRSGLIDVVVVYKVDRLTRSLADFAQLVALFERHGVSFVSVTQAFNTTSSMGRLTLNVLLSFAQFEREVTAERIRDKVAASKQKGMWMGGVVPLGYAARDRSLQVVPEQAQLVRELYQRYLALGSVGALHAALIREGVRVPERRNGKGQPTGGGPFSRGHLHKLLTNPVYRGEVAHKGERHKGQHEAIVSTELFQAVQERLGAQCQAHTQRHASGALLQGRILDDAGHHMSPSHASKGGVRYRYYVSQALLQGRRDQAGSAPRVPAPEVEAAVVGALRAKPGRPPGQSDRELVERCLERVVVRPGTLEVSLRPECGSVNGEHRTPEPPLVLPWQSTPSRVRREVIAPGGQDVGDEDRAGWARVRPIRSEARARLLPAIARARAWVEELSSGKVGGTQVIALREGLSERGVRQQLGLAFLAPDIVEAALQGTLPRGLGLSRMLDLPACWQAQRQALGITSPQR